MESYSVGIAAARIAPVYGYMWRFVVIIIVASDTTMVASVHSGLNTNPIL